MREEEARFAVSEQGYGTTSSSVLPVGGGPTGAKLLQQLSEKSNILLCLKVVRDMPLIRKRDLE